MRLLKLVCSSTALSLALSGCIAVNAAGPLPAPGGGRTEVGADYRRQAINRWYCSSLGSFVLARDGGDFALHLENRDWVFPLQQTSGHVSTQYSWFRAVTYNGALGGVAGAILTGVAAAQSTSGTVRLDAQTSPRGTLKVTLTSQDANMNPLQSQEEECAPVTP